MLLLWYSAKEAGEDDDQHVPSPDYTTTQEGGESIAGISRKVGVSRDTVYKYLERDDFSLAMPVKKPAKSIMDEYRPVIEGYFEEDARSWRKQRHTAKRIHERLRDEHGCEASESTVRHYVARIRKECVPSASSFLTLVWAPGEAQADFGEADFYLNGVRTRLFYLVVTFPFSTSGSRRSSGARPRSASAGGSATCSSSSAACRCAPSSTTPPRSAAGRRADRHLRALPALRRALRLDYSFTNPHSGNEKVRGEQGRDAQEEPLRAGAAGVGTRMSSFPFSRGIFPSYRSRMGVTVLRLRTWQCPPRCRRLRRRSG